MFEEQLRDVIKCSHQSYIHPCFGPIAKPFHFPAVSLHFITDILAVRGCCAVTAMNFNILYLTWRIINQALFPSPGQPSSQGSRMSLSALFALQTGELPCKGTQLFVHMLVFTGIYPCNICLQSPQIKLNLPPALQVHPHHTQPLGFCPKVQLRLSQLDSSTEMMDWADFWNQTSSWGDRAGNKTLDQAQVRDAEEAFLAWAEGLLRRCGQGE